MQPNPPSLLERFTEQLQALTTERATLVARMKEIDDSLSKAARQLGVIPEPLEAVPEEPLSRLPSGHRLDPETMGPMMVEILLKADHGYTRAEMRKALEDTPKIAQQITGNANSYYNTVSRYLKKKRITDVGGLLYHPDRAPLSSGEVDPSGSHLPANVSNLFAGIDRKTDAG